jgi:D-alanyl-D-alanine carboxypeptidase
VIRKTPATRTLASAGVVFVVFATTALAAAETPDELREQRKQVQEEAALVAAEVDAIEGDVETVTAALEALQASVEAQEAAVADAERAVAGAEDASEAAADAVVRLEQELLLAQLEIRGAAVQAYVSFQNPQGHVNSLSADPWRQAREEALVEFATGSRLDQIDRLRAIGAELEDQRAIAAETEAEAARQRGVVEERLADLQIALDRQAAVVEDAETRLESRLNEALALEALDAELARRIEAEERRIAAAIAAQRAAERRAAAAAAAAAAAEEAGQPVTIPTAPVDLVTVGGIVVNATIADQLRGLLGEMAAAGFGLGGGGYRSSDAQIALRMANCGTSNYAIWEMPASSCRPPTARPGLSDHERGLAIDFTYDGFVIRDRSSAVFQALSNIAPRYGFVNLPSEPWHWSAA